MKSYTVRQDEVVREGVSGREGGIPYLCLDFVDVVPGSIEIYNIKGLSLKTSLIFKKKHF